VWFDVAGSVANWVTTCRNLRSIKQRTEDAAEFWLAQAEAGRRFGVSGGRLTTLLSTLSGVHGSAQRNTEVPRKKLVEELERHSNLVATNEFQGTELRRDVSIDLSAT